MALSSPKLLTGAVGGWYHHSDAADHARVAMKQRCFSVLTTPRLQPNIGYKQNAECQELPSTSHRHSFRALPSDRTAF